MVRRVRPPLAVPQSALQLLCAALRAALGRAGVARAATAASAWTAVVVAACAGPVLCELVALALHTGTYWLSVSRQWRGRGSRPKHALCQLTCQHSRALTATWASGTGKCLSVWQWLLTAVAASSAPPAAAPPTVQLLVVLAPAAPTPRHRGWCAAPLGNWCNVATIRGSFAAQASRRGPHTAVRWATRVAVSQLHAQAAASRLAALHASNRQPAQTLQCQRDTEVCAHTQRLLCSRHVACAACSQIRAHTSQRHTVSSRLSSSVETMESLEATMRHTGARQP